MRKAIITISTALISALFGVMTFMASVPKDEAVGNIQTYISGWPEWAQNPICYAILAGLFFLVFLWSVFFLKGPTAKAYPKETVDKMNRLRQLVIDIDKGITAGQIDKIQQWDKELREYTLFCNNLNCWDELQPIVQSTRHILAYSKVDSFGDKLEAAYTMFYEGVAVGKFMDKTKWAIT